MYLNYLELIKCIDLLNEPSRSLEIRTCVRPSDYFV